MANYLESGINRDDAVSDFGSILDTSRYSEYAIENTLNERCELFQQMQLIEQSDEKYKLDNFLKNWIFISDMSVDGVITYPELQELFDISIKRHEIEKKVTNELRCFFNNCGFFEVIDENNFVCLIDYIMLSENQEEAFQAIILNLINEFVLEVDEEIKAQLRMLL